MLTKVDFESHLINMKVVFLTIIANLFNICWKCSGPICLILNHRSIWWNKKNWKLTNLVNCCGVLRTIAGQKCWKCGKLCLLKAAWWLVTMYLAKFSNSLSWFHTIKEYVVWQLFEVRSLWFIASQKNLSADNWISMQSDDQGNSVGA